MHNERRNKATPIHWFSYLFANLLGSSLNFFDFGDIALVVRDVVCITITSVRYSVIVK
jgi:hypothetical protein